MASEIAWSDTDGFLLLWGFVKDRVYISSLPTALHELKTCITEACP
jgi:hypothetical protein